MPVLGLYLQHKDGTNLVLHTKANWSVKMACQVTQDVAAQLAQLRKEDYGPLGLRTIEPHFASGRVTSLSFYQVAYELVSDIYVAVVQHIDDNPFYSDTTLDRAKSGLCSIVKSEKIGYEEIQKKHGEVWSAMEKILDASRSDALDDWVSVEKRSQETRDVLDSLFAIDFEIPVEMLPEARPQNFGSVFGDVTNRTTPLTARRSLSVMLPTTSSGASTGQSTSATLGKAGRSKSTEKSSRKVKAAATMTSSGAARAAVDRKASSRTFSKSSRAASTSPLKQKSNASKTAPLDSTAPSLGDSSSRLSLDSTKAIKNPNDALAGTGGLNSSQENSISKLPSSETSSETGSSTVKEQQTSTSQTATKGSGQAAAADGKSTSSADTIAGASASSGDASGSSGMVAKSSESRKILEMTPLVIDTVEEESDDEEEHGMDAINSVSSSAESSDDDLAEDHYGDLDRGLETPRLESPTDSDASDDENDENDHDDDTTSHTGLNTAEEDPDDDEDMLEEPSATSTPSVTTPAASSPTTVFSIPVPQMSHDEDHANVDLSSENTTTPKDE